MMFIYSARPYRVDGDPNDIEYVIATDEHKNPLGHYVFNELIITRGENEWIIFFNLDDGTRCRFVKHMTRKEWHRLWAEYRFLSH